MLPAFVGRAMLRLNGMRVLDRNEGQWPAKCVVAVAPHTSNRDFPYGLYVRAAVKQYIGFVGKASLFKFPLGIFLRAWGGVPVVRTKRTNFVQAVAQIFREKSEFRLCLAIEGTRSRVDKFKTGFYYIAKEAQVPIILCRFNFGDGNIEFSKPFYPTDDFRKDMDFIYRHFDGIKGLVPENSFIYDPEKAFAEVKPAKKGA
ncbi:MAG: 1-acyl-sn-glycerol-3-phosphate acyltransferase [Bacteroidota bacterium]